MKFCLLLFLFTYTLSAQDSTSTLKLEGSIECYYLFDPANPGPGTRPSFLYSYNQQNQLALNLGFLRFSYSNNLVRTNLAFMKGTYADANLSGEGDLKIIYEANVGVRPGSNRNSWIDFGVLPSHIGFESAEGKENWTLSRSMVADNSPYYETGLRWSFNHPNKQLYFAAFLLNGWQNIKMNGAEAGIGWQLQIKTKKSLLFNWSTYLGVDEKRPRSWSQRYYNNLYLQGTFKKIDVLGGFDLGNLYSPPGEPHLWHASVLLLRYRLQEKHRLAIRYEEFHDLDGLIVWPEKRRNMNHLRAYSFNYDFAFGKFLLWRIEIRNFETTEPLFTTKKGLSGSNLAYTTALSLYF